MALYRILTALFGPPSTLLLTGTSHGIQVAEKLLSSDRKTNTDGRFGVDDYALAGIAVRNAITVLDIGRRRSGGVAI